MCIVFERYEHSVIFWYFCLIISRPFMSLPKPDQPCMCVSVCMYVCVCLSDGASRGHLGHSYLYHLPHLFFTHASHLYYTALPPHLRSIPFVSLISYSPSPPSPYFPLLRRHLKKKEKKTKPKKKKKLALITHSLCCLLLKCHTNSALLPNTFSNLIRQIWQLGLQP